jgi:hypothetical protein
VAAPLISIGILVVGLFLLWIIASIPAWLAGKAITGGRATFGQAMGATLGGAIVYFLVLFGVTFFLGAVIGVSAAIWALVLAFVAWLAVYRASFNTGWLGALGIAALTVIVFLVLNVVVVGLFGVTFPEAFPFPVPNGLPFGDFLPLPPRS